MDPEEWLKKNIAELEKEMWEREWYVNISNLDEIKR